ncbi:MAG: class I SAM-dependent methyltransferase [Planctomycetota bacterium]
MSAASDRDLHADPLGAAPQPLDRAAAEKLPHEVEHLEALERMRGLEPYYRWVLELFERLSGGPVGRRVLDAGCGIGNFVELLRGRADEVLAVDLSPRNIAVLRERFRCAANVEVMQTDLDAERAALRARALDAIVCLDVLEHLDDDAGLVRAFFDILPAGGQLFIKVPAHQWLFGTLDEASDHRRRYSKRALVALVRAAGFEVRAACYMNLVGVAPYFVKGRVLRRRSTLSNSFSASQLAWIRRSIGVFRVVDRVTGPFVGQSVVLVARRPAI